MKFAQEHGITLKGHPLVYDQTFNLGLPDWVTPKPDEIDRLLRIRIERIAARYASSIKIWDIELAQISERTHEVIMEKCYSVLEETLSTAEFDEQGIEYTEKGRAAIRKAVQSERERLWDSQPPPKEAATELGREIQKRTSAPSVMVNRIVRRMAKQVLQSEAGEGEKPN